MRCPITKAHILNHEIRAREVRVIDVDGTQLGILNLREAIQIAQDKGLDLALISPDAKPPVCKIIDYGKFKYQQKKKAQEAKKNQVQVILKEIKLRPKTDQHDLDYKVKNAKRFLAEGDKAKFIMQFRGREIEFKEIGLKLLDEVVELLTKDGHVEQAPKVEGRTITMIVAPGQQTKKPGATLQIKTAGDSENVAASAQAAAVNNSNASSSLNTPSSEDNKTSSPS